MRQLTPAIVGAALLSAAVFDPSHSQRLDTSDRPPATELLLNSPQDDVSRRLSRDQIKVCMRRAADIDEHNKSMKDPGLKLERDRQDLEAKSEALKDAERLLSRRSQKAVDEFNKKVADANEAQKAFNASVSTYNGSRDQGQVLVQAYNVECAGKPYSKDDEDPVRSELGLAQNPMKLIQPARGALVQPR